ncbi:hypothetical protein [Natrinema gelatinilyticum]|uniref:hypothetical protein n=1 Tax=Natrinema gelatinilyticum TaxID=2961571 RepID=UPI0020C2095A|nr:hypothetical protein [Natrinema gelatinilyticum]
MTPKFEPSRTGVEIIDPIERHRYQLTIDESISLEPASTDQIDFPTGSVVRFTARSIELPAAESIIVRNANGMMVAEVPPTERVAFRPDEYTLDLSGPLKIYVRIESAVRIFSDTDHTYVAFDGKTDVILGARSFHERPAGTITTTADPTDVMAAVSVFGQELQTTAPERSYSTLRGHPPRLELGSELHVSDEFDRTDHGVRIDVPDTLRHVFVVAPLAYYLGASVGSGSEPEIVTDRGYTYALDTADGFESSVARALQQVFFLDCVVRTEGKTPLELYERQVIEPALPFDIATAYDQCLAERIETYLETPYPTVEPHLPDWGFETRLESAAETVRFLPFIANDLAIVSTEASETAPSSQESRVEQTIEAFTRSDPVTRARTRTGRGTAADTPSTGPPQLATLQQVWTGINDSEIVSTTPLGAYENNIGRTPKDGPIEIECICNDPDMRTELESVNGTYGAREELPFEITAHYDLTRAELTDVLAIKSDFLHYIGHIDETGFQCSNGRLDATTVDTVGAKAFLLNACQSHDQGLALVAAGSIGGIVTLGNVTNSSAICIGSTIARLLNLGFPLYAALDIAREDSVVGQQYVMVGDGRTTIAQSETGIPNVCIVTRNGDSIAADIRMYTSAEIKRGCIFSPYLDPVTSYYVLPRDTERLSVSTSQLEEFFAQGQFPVLLDGSLQWSGDILPSES